MREKMRVIIDLSIKQISIIENDAQQKSITQRHSIQASWDMSTPLNLVGIVVCRHSKMDGDNVNDM